MSRLGRNPLDKISEKKQRILPALDRVQVQKLRLIEKVRELQVQVDWEELYRATIENKINKLCRFFLQF